MTLIDLLLDGFWSGIAALGFAMLFNVPRRTLLGCALAGALGHALRTLLMQQGFTIEGGTLACAMVVGFLSQAFGRQWHAPAIIFAVPGVIPMIPGRFAYSTMINLLQLAQLGSAAPQTVLLEASVNGVKTAMILGALAAGIAAPSLLLQRDKLRS